MVKNPLKCLCIPNLTCFGFFPTVLFSSKILLFTNLVLLLESKLLVHGFTDEGSYGVALGSGPCHFCSLFAKAGLLRSSQPAA